MYTRNGADAYQATNASTMSKEKIIVALYERMVSDLSEAGLAIKDGDRVKMTNRVNHSQQIVIELRNALDHEIGGEISRNLESLYDFLFQQHLQVIVDCDHSHIDNCLRTISPLLEAWRSIPVGTAERASRDHAQGKLVTPNEQRTAIIKSEPEEKPAELVSVSA
ncbi:MAG: flagellar protein FliS [Candidatus Krumholzibacteriia bacterium]|jgi:flagellar protein FliS